MYGVYMQQRVTITVDPGLDRPFKHRIGGRPLSDLSDMCSLTRNMLHKRLHEVVHDTPPVDLPRPCPRFPFCDFWTYAHRVQFYEYMEKFYYINKQEKLTKEEYDFLSEMKESPCFQMFYMTHDPSPAFKRDGRLHFGTAGKVTYVNGFKVIQFRLLDLHSKTFTLFRMRKDTGLEVVGDRFRSAAGEWAWIDGVYVFV